MKSELYKLISVLKARPDGIYYEVTRTYAVNKSMSDNLGKDYIYRNASFLLHQDKDLIRKFCGFFLVPLSPFSFDLIFKGVNSFYSTSAPGPFVPPSMTKGPGTRLISIGCFLCSRPKGCGSRSRLRTR